jgi:hypothetical protein
VILVEVNEAFGMQLLVSLIGIALSIGLASLLGWWRQAARSTATARTDARSPLYTRNAA